MQHKVLVHDDKDALDAERAAMHTGRAEAWRHGKVHNEMWTEVDLRNAYVTIAATHDLPRKIHMHHGAMPLNSYGKLKATFAVLCRVVVDTSVPCVPVRLGGRHVWPTGKFETWLWDCEVDVAIKEADSVRIVEAYSYVRAPILQEWGNWVLSIISGDRRDVPSIVRTHVKHCGRALIGRIALRVPSWEYFGDNPEQLTTITHVTYPDTGKSHRMLHVGGDTLIEMGREESDNSMPMITGYIMSACRVQLWQAMNVAGLDNLAHVDTDSVLVNVAGLRNMRAAYGDRFAAIWSIKGTYTSLEIFGPRAYYRDKQRVAAGIPLKATEVSPGEFSGERWSAVASDLERGATGSVSVAPATWVLRRSDPRRTDAGEGRGRTRAYSTYELDVSSSSAGAAGRSGS
jgi:hypothetical protein